MRQVLIRRKFKTQIIVSQTIDKCIIENTWKMIKKKRQKVIEIYLRSYSLQLFERSRISMADRNSYNIVKEKNFNKIETYVVGFAGYTGHLKYLNTVVRGQNLIRTWITRRRFVKLRKATIIIQRAWRTYYFKKKGAKAMFS